MLNERIPLTKVKTMRKTLSEKSMLKNFLKEHAYRQSQISSRGSNITIHPLRNIMDVSVLGVVLHSAPSCSSLALGLIWRGQVGCWGWDSYRRQKAWETCTPPREEGTLILNSWSW